MKRLKPLNKLLTLTGTRGYVRATLSEKINTPQATRNHGARGGNGHGNPMRNPPRPRSPEPMTEGNREGPKAPGDQASREPRYFTLRGPRNDADLIPLHVVRVQGLITLVTDALQSLGYTLNDHQVHCLEDTDVQNELREGGVWIYAPDQGPCTWGEAYRVHVTNDRAKEIELAVRLIETLEDYLYEKNGWIPHGGEVEEVVRAMARKIKDVEYEETGEE